MEDTNSTIQSYSPERFSDSVLMEIQLQSLLSAWKRSEGEYIVLPVILTNGVVAIANFDSIVWPQWIRSAIREKLLQAGGVPSVCPLQILRDSEGSPYVQPAKRQDTKLTAIPAELATDDDASE